MQASILEELRSVGWRHPWQPAGPGPGLDIELRREVGVLHRLHGREATSVARRVDNDDVLFFLPGSTPPLVVVHLTWARHPEPSEDWPAIRFFSSVQEWVRDCMEPDAWAVAGEPP